MDSGDGSADVKLDAVAPSPDLAAAPGLLARARAWLIAHWRLAALVAAGAAIFGALAVALKPLEVTVSPALRGPAVSSVYASGVVEFVRQADVAPVVTAAIRVVRSREGENVRTGQILAELADGPEQATALQLAATSAQARDNAHRTQRLYESGYAARAARDDARREYEAAEAAARGARERLADYRLAAPFSGVVIRRDAEPGDLARAGSVMFVIADTRALRITADVDERDAARMTTGLKALVRSDAFPDQRFDAVVTEVTPQGDSAARVFRARLALGPDVALRPGMTVEANIITARRDNAILAPSAAISGGFVWIVSGGAAHRRTVKIGVQGPALTEIVSGVEVEDQLILAPPAGLRDGARVAAARRPHT